MTGDEGHDSAGRDGTDGVTRGFLRAWFDGRPSFRHIPLLERTETRGRPPAWERRVKARAILKPGRRTTALLRLRRLGALLCLLAVIGVGVTEGVAWAQPGVGATAMVRIPAAVPGTAGSVLPAGCAVQAAFQAPCPAFIPAAAPQPDGRQRSVAGGPEKAESRTGRTTRPALPPPKPTLQG